MLVRHRQGMQWPEWTRAHQQEIGRLSRESTPPTAPRQAMFALLGCLSNRVERTASSQISVNRTSLALGLRHPVLTLPNCESFPLPDQLGTPPPEHLGPTMTHLENPGF